mmetsp:Transcript_15555/g.39608  ORF Transcript_15555/g.39608 Transcript_15555/m.39608 type:complete len:268 (+) Transcript_15555:1372-2175(+)
MWSMYSVFSAAGLVSSKRRQHRPSYRLAMPKSTNMALAWPMWRYPFGSGGKRVMTLPPVSARCFSSSSLVFAIRMMWPSLKLTVVCTTLFSLGFGRNAYGSAGGSSAALVFSFSASAAAAAFCFDFFSFFFCAPLAISASVFGPRISRIFASNFALSSFWSAHLMFPIAFSFGSRGFTQVYRSVISLSPSPSITFCSAASMSSSSTVTPMPPERRKDSESSGSSPTPLRYSKQPSSWLMLLSSSFMMLRRSTGRCTKAFGGNLDAVV